MYKILFVDDEPSLLEQAKIFLEEEESELDVSTFTSVDKGLDAVENEEFDAIISNYRMPEKSGLEFLKILREKRESNTPFIIFTGKGREEVAIEALNLGANRYIRKGGDPESQYGVLSKAVIQEIKHKEAEEKLEWQVKAMESSLDGMAILNEDHEYVYANNAHAEMYGYESPDEYIGQKWSILDLERLEEDTIPAVFEEGEWRGEAIGQRKDGSTLPLELSLTPLDDGGIVCIARDISDRKRIEDKLRKSEERFRRFFENQADAIFIHTANPDHYGEILEVNQAATEQTGYSKDELIGMKIKELKSGDPEDTSPNKVVEKVNNEETFLITQKKKKKDGSEYWTEVIKTPIDYKGINSALSISRDITERKRAQEREAFLHSLLRHDLRNKAQVVQGYLEHLHDTDISDQQEEILERAINGNEKGIELIEKVRTLRKLEKGRGVGKVDLGSILKNTVSEYREVADENDISIDLKDGEYKVKGGSLLRELFSNILGNSIQHSGCDKISISSEKKDGEVAVVIKDDGCGIPDDIKTKIFQKGFKKGKNAGSGLGMHLVKRIVESYGGSVRAEDSDEGGAKFVISLQLTED